MLNVFMWVLTRQRQETEFVTMSRNRNSLRLWQKQQDSRLYKIKFTPSLFSQHHPNKFSILFSMKRNRYHNLFPLSSWHIRLFLEHFSSVNLAEAPLSFALHASMPAIMKSNYKLLLDLDESLKLRRVRSITM